MTNEVLPLRPGEPVTIVRQWSVVLTIVEVSTLQDFRGFDVGGPFLLRENGISWVRGHHLPDSELVRAARAAGALAAPDPVPSGPQGATGATGVSGAFPSAPLFPSAPPPPLPIGTPHGYPGMKLTP